MAPAAERVRVREDGRRLAITNNMCFKVLLFFLADNLTLVGMSTRQLDHMSACQCVNLSTYRYDRYRLIRGV